jgi:uncharacterized protein DUF3142
MVRFDMRVGVMIASICVSSCVGSLHSQPPPAKWTTGFWFWRASPVEVAEMSQTLDVLFVHAGDIRAPEYKNNPREGFVYGDLPRDLPLAREYWLVFRYARQGVPDLHVAAMLGEEASRLAEAARQRHLRVVGVQLDVDSPTGALSQYAGFLREVRKGLPRGLEISITALLDWFRGGTAITEVIKETDEFVPQFYDVANPEYGSGTAIAARVDGAKWASIFNRFGRRYRIGISTFGRVKLVRRQNAIQWPYARNLSFGFSDVTPLDFATRQGFFLETSRNEANELVLTYRAARKVRIDYEDFEQGNAMQFVLPTPEAVRLAVESAKLMRGYCAGVVFFRWPGSGESLVMRPDQVLSAAGFATQQAKPTIHLVDGGCAAVNCVDVYLINASALDPKPVRYRVHSSTELEYFLPEERMPVRMTDASDFELSLPPYSGRPRMYLGRAVTAKRAVFTVEEEP